MVLEVWIARGGAALGGRENQHWFIGFCLKLIFIALQGLGIEFTVVSCSVKELPEGFVVTGNRVKAR